MIKAALAALCLLTTTACPSLVRTSRIVPIPTIRTYGQPNALQPSPSPSQQQTEGPPPAPTPRASKSLAKLDDLDAVGTAGRALLKKQPFSKIIIEVHQVEGKQPSDAAMDHLISTLHSVTGKAIERAPSIILPVRGSAYSIPEIQDLSLKRSTHSIEPQVSLMIFYLDGHLKEAPTTLGATVGATVLVLFKDRIEALTNESDSLEAAALVHELGHILGLINYGYETPRPRQDPEHPGHSSNRESVMYWAIDRAEVAFELGTVPPRDFDADDLADLKDLASGRL